MLRGLIALLIVIGVLVVLAGLGRSSGTQNQPDISVPPITAVKPGLPKPPAPEIVRPVQIVLECETPTTLEDKAPNGEVMLRVGRANMGQSIGFLESPDKSIDRAMQEKLKDKNQGGLVSGKAVYEFQVPRDDDYYLFLRAKWMDDCGDSVWLRCDQEPYLCVQDSIGKLSDANYKWAWHPATEQAEPKVFKLKAGKHTAELNVREDGPQFDKILIATDATPPSESEVYPTGGTAP